MSKPEQTIDEFGRDLSLKYPVYEPIRSEYLNRFKGMSWAEICYLVEEEEEEQERLQQEIAQEIRRQCELAARREEAIIKRQLLAQGLYDLEEGEVFE
jgi:hypothetical protein